MNPPVVMATTSHSKFMNKLKEPLEIVHDTTFVKNIISETIVKVPVLVLLV